MKVDYVTIGEVTIDDTVLENGKVLLGQTGGGTVYSALGIRLWEHRVGINAVIGHDYSEENLAALREHGISTEGIQQIDDWSLRYWILHEENNKKQILHKIQAASIHKLDEVRSDPPPAYWDARGYHLAPATPAGQTRARNTIRKHKKDALISLDIFTEPYIDLVPYRDGSAFRGVDIFSPSIVEIETLWPGKTVEEAIQILTQFGIRWIAVKMDTRGSIVHDTKENVTHHIPIYPAVTVDSTGAGDAYSGGFLEGITETGRVLDAGIRGTISASFAVEHRGAFGMINVTRQEAVKRARWLREKIDK